MFSGKLILLQSEVIKRDHGLKLPQLSWQTAQKLDSSTPCCTFNITLGGLMLRNLTSSSPSFALDEAAGIQQGYHTHTTRIARELPSHPTGSNKESSATGGSRSVVSM